MRHKLLTGEKSQKHPPHLPYLSYPPHPLGITVGVGVWLGVGEP
jgi:hypothetical protein